MSLAKVKRGAEFLDSKKPGWFSNVDLGVLDLSKGDKCILGQLFGSYFDGCYVLSLQDEEKLVELGFLINEIPKWKFWTSKEKQYRTLTKYWRNEIKIRLLLYVALESYGSGG